MYSATDNTTTHSIARLDEEWFSEEIDLLFGKSLNFTIIVIVSNTQKMD